MTWLEFEVPSQENSYGCTASEAVLEGRTELILWWMIRGRRDVLCNVLRLLVLRCPLASDMQQCCYLEAPEHKHTAFTAYNQMKCDRQRISSLNRPRPPLFTPCIIYFHPSILNRFLIYCLSRQHLKNVPACSGCKQSVEHDSESSVRKAHVAVWKYPHLQMFKGVGAAMSPWQVLLWVLGKSLRIPLAPKDQLHEDKWSLTLFCKPSLKRF